MLLVSSEVIMLGICAVHFGLELTAFRRSHGGSNNAVEGLETPPVLTFATR